VPLYEYVCKKCGRRSERIEKMDGPRMKKCPTCGGKVEQVLSPPAIQFKGSGWYVTDYAGKAASAEAGKTAGADSAKSEAKESKTEATTVEKSSDKSAEKKAKGPTKEK